MGEGNFFVKKSECFRNDAGDYAVSGCGCVCCDGARAAGNCRYAANATAGQVDSSRPARASVTVGEYVRCRWRGGKCGEHGRSGVWRGKTATLCRGISNFVQT